MSPNHPNPNYQTHSPERVRSILHAIPALHSKMNAVILALQEQYFPLSVERLLLYQEIQKILRLEDLNDIKDAQIKKIDPRIIQEIEVWCKLQKLQHENQNVGVDQLWKKGKIPSQVYAELDTNQQNADQNHEIIEVLGKSDKYDEQQALNNITYKPLVCHQDDQVQYSWGIFGLIEAWKLDPTKPTSDLPKRTICLQISDDIKAKRTQAQESGSNDRGDPSPKSVWTQATMCKEIQEFIDKMYKEHKSYADPSTSKNTVKRWKIAKAFENGDQEVKARGLIQKLDPDQLYTVYQCLIQGHLPTTALERVAIHQEIKRLIWTYALFHSDQRKNITILHGYLKDHQKDPLAKCLEEIRAHLQIFVKNSKDIATVHNILLQQHKDKQYHADVCYKLAQINAREAIQQLNGEVRQVAEEYMKHMIPTQALQTAQAGVRNTASQKYTPSTQNNTANNTVSQEAGGAIPLGDVGFDQTYLYPSTTSGKHTAEESKKLSNNISGLYKKCN